MAALPGRIVEEQKSFFTVDTSEGPVRATIRGILKKSKIRICTGDLVDIEITNQQPREGIITLVHERSSYLRRPAVANLSQVFFVCTLNSPSIDFEALDRFLFSAEVYHLKPLIVFNKTDILADSETEKLRTISDLYREIGYSVLSTSAVSGHGITELINLCRENISVFAGLSGVGKSTLLSKIFPDKQFRIGYLSGSTGRGTHTTTHISLLRLSEGGYIADTPGLSFIEIPHIPEEEVATYFPELLSRIGQCRFNNCIHNGEPGCKIIEMLQKKQISETRHAHYLKIFQEMKTIRRQYHSTN